MSVQLYVLTKKQTERKPDPLLSPPNIFFSFPRRIVYLLCFMHWVTIDIDKNSITFCFPHSRNWAGKGGGAAGNKAKKSLTPLPAKGDQGEEGNGCTTITIVLKTNDRTAFFTFNINKTNSQWVYFITLITIHNTKQSLCKKRATPPHPKVNAPPIQYMLKILSWRAPGRASFLTRARVNGWKTTRKNKKLTFNNNEG